MATFMAACLAVWLGVVLYVGRLGLRQQRLQQDLEALQDRRSAGADARQPPARAA